MKGKKQEEKRMKYEHDSVQLRAEFYDEWYRYKLKNHTPTPCSNLWDTAEKIMIEYVIKNVRSGESILDFGCGTGKMLEHFRDTSAQLFGTDISKYAIDICRKKIKGASSVSIFLWEGKPLHKDYFDWIICNQVIEHVTTQQAGEMVNHLKSMLKPGGRLIIATNNRDRIMMILQKLLPQKIQQIPWLVWLRDKQGKKHSSQQENENPVLSKYKFKVHEHDYSYKELSKLLKKHGFRIRKKFLNTMIIFPPTFYNVLVRKIPGIHKIWRKIDLLTKSWPLLPFKSNMTIIAQKRET